MQRVQYTLSQSVEHSYRVTTQNMLLIEWKLINPYGIEFGNILLVLCQSIICIVTALINGVKKIFHLKLNDLYNMLASAFHQQFKLSWLKDNGKINVITERMIKLVNEKERLHTDRNTQSSSEEEGKESNDIFAALLRKSSLRDKDGKKKQTRSWKCPRQSHCQRRIHFLAKPFDNFFYKIQYSPSIHYSS